MLMFGDNYGSDIVSRDDLSEAQLSALKESDLARSPVDVREGMIALYQAVLIDSGLLIVAGTWEGSLELGNWSIQSSGGRDIFLAELSVNGTWSSVQPAGSPGEDSISSLSISGEMISLWGRVNGDAQFGSYVLNHDSGWSPTPFEAHIYIDGEWDGVWQIDEELMPQDSTNLWCGFA